jgi:hypothetical protein
MLCHVALVRATWPNIPEDAILHGHRRENLISYKSSWFCDWWSVGQFILVLDILLEPMTKFFLLLSSFRQLTCTSYMGCSLWWEDVSVICSWIAHYSEPRRSHNHILLSHLRPSQPRWPGPITYIPQGEDGPVISPGTGFPSRHPLWLTGTPVELELSFRLMVRPPVCLGVGPMTRYWFLFFSLTFTCFFMKGTLSDERNGSVFCNAHHSLVSITKDP